MVLSIVIVNWNAGKYIENCIESIYQYRPSCEMEIIVVDNASSDGSPDRVLEQFPEVNVIRNNQNGGFARANNQAIRSASGDLVLLLNPDTEVLSNAISSMVEFLTAHPSAGVIGPRLSNSDGTLQFSCDPFPTLARELWRLLHLDMLHSYSTYDIHGWDLALPKSVDTLKGACLLIPRTVLDEVGLFDEIFFMYTEEVDLCYRIKKAGWDLFWLPTSVIIHHGSQSTRQVASNMFHHLYHSKLLFFRKHYGKISSWIYKIILLITSMIRLALIPLTMVQSSQKRKKQIELAMNYFRLIRSIPSL